MGAFIEHFENGRKADRHNLYVPGEDVQLFLAVAVYFASPITAVLIWMTMVTNRRISEALRIRACNIHLSGSRDCDKPRFGEREGEEEYSGIGKLGADEICAKLPIVEGVAMLRSILDSGVPWELLPALALYQSSHPHVFKKYKPFSKAAFTPARGSDLMFPALKKSDTPWLSRQTAWNTIDRTRTVMFDLTGRRRYNPSKKFNGMHVTVHGATRHTSASLLLYNPDAKMPPPSEATILEVQQRSDADTFRRHYHTIRTTSQWSKQCRTRGSSHHSGQSPLRHRRSPEPRPQQQWNRRRQAWLAMPRKTSRLKCLTRCRRRRAQPGMHGVSGRGRWGSNEPWWS